MRKIELRSTAKFSDEGKDVDVSISNPSQVFQTIQNWLTHIGERKVVLLTALVDISEFQESYRSIYLDECRANYDKEVLRIISVPNAYGLVGGKEKVSLLHLPPTKQEGRSDMPRRREGRAGGTL